MPDSEGGTPSSGETPIDWDAWIAEQPATIQELFEGKVGGLKSALNSERENRKVLEKAQKAAERAATAAAQAKLAEQEEYQQLAEQRLTEIDALTAEKAAWENEKLLQRVATAFREEANRQKLTWANPMAVDDALKTVDVAALKYDASGRPEGMDAVVKDLTKTRPYYFKVAQAPGNISANEGRGTEPAGTGAAYQAKIAQRFGTKASA